MSWLSRAGSHKQTLMGRFSRVGSHRQALTGRLTDRLSQTGSYKQAHMAMLAVRLSREGAHGQVLTDRDTGMRSRLLRAADRYAYTLWKHCLLLST